MANKIVNKTYFNNLSDAILKKFFEVCENSINLSKEIRQTLNKVKDRVHKTNGNSRRAANTKK